jgi:hypothetical protein
MKRLLVVIFCLRPSLAGAEPELGVALKGGLDTATLSNDRRGSRCGFSGGLSSHLQWTFTDRFSMAGQIDLLYTPRGAEVIFDGVSQGALRQHYFDVVVAARPEARLGRAGVYLLLGGGLNFLVSASDEDASGMSRDVTDDLRRRDVALLVGAGVALHFRQGHRPIRLGAVFLEGRHDHGLIDIDPMDGGFKNRTSSLMLGLSFALGSRGPAVQSAPPPSPAPVPSDPPSSVPAPSDPPSPAEVSLPAE